MIESTFNASSSVQRNGIDFFNFEESVSNLWMFALQHSQFFGEYPPLEHFGDCSIAAAGALVLHFCLILLAELFSGDDQKE